MISIDRPHTIWWLMTSLALFMSLFLSGSSETITIYGFHIRQSHMGLWVGAIFRLTGFVYWLVD